MSLPVNQIEFSSDTAHRKQWFRGCSFSHPAKMHLSLQMYLIEHYTKPGDIILDCMSGSGTLLVACALGRNVICVELEKKFVDMQKANWGKIKALGPILGYKMGEVAILQGDARNLEGLLADSCIFSPPYARDKGGEKGMLISDQKRKNDASLYRTYSSKNNIDNLPYGEVSAVISSPPHGNRLADDACKDNDPQRMSYRQSLGKIADCKECEYYEKKGNACWYDPANPKKISQPNGKCDYHKTKRPYADAVITSPPYEGSDVSQTHMTSNQRGDPSNPEYRPSWKEKIKKGYCKTKRPYTDVICTSPPYEAINTTGKADSYIGSRGPHSQVQIEDYRHSKNNIGNLKSENYLQAMLQVYQQCHRVLRDGGLMILVVKNFIRNKKIVRLDTDTIKLCESAGFVLKERLKRRLTQQSFWRTIYYKKYPDAPKIEFEDVLIFRKGLFE